MVAFVKSTGEWLDESTMPTAEAAHKYFTDAGSSIGSPTLEERGPKESPTGTALFGYSGTESVRTGRRFEPLTDATQQVVIGTRDQDIEVLTRSCKNLIERILETEDIIERENLYQTLNQYLVSLFELRSSREREFGHLMVLLLGVTQHTTSEFFGEKQFSALDRAIKIARKPTIGHRDLQEAEDLLIAADFDVFRPLRAVFDTDNV